MAAHMAARSLSLLTRWQRRYCSHQPFLHLLAPIPLLSANKPHHRLFFSGAPSRALRLADAPLSPEFDESETDSEDNAKRSRNAKKRDARRAVGWAEELTDFSPAQLKRILRAASLGPEVLDSIMVAKRLGRHVREGKRRQISYIGKFLREVEPELMEQLIRATRDGDMSMFQSVSAAEDLAVEHGEEEETKFEDEDDVQGNPNYNEIATRWFDGLVNKEADITNEIYSLRSVEIDRQELRRLVRQIHVSEEEKEGQEVAKKSLTNFLKTLARQLPIE
jgi:ribosomal 50S subunit-associated protein YjgA (DUF615 family)